MRTDRTRAVIVTLMGLILFGMVCQQLLAGHVYAKHGPDVPLKSGWPMLAIEAAYGIGCLIAGTIGLVTGVMPGSRASRRINNERLTPQQAVGLSIFALIAVGITVMIARNVLQPTPEENEAGASLLRNAGEVWRTVMKQARKNPKHKIPAFDSDHRPSWWSDADPLTPALLPGVHYRVVPSVVGQRLEQLKRPTDVLSLDGPEVTKEAGRPYTLQW